MVSLKQPLCITGLMLIVFVIYTQQEALADEEYQLEKRRDGHARTSIPLFRGSNLGIFVRKRPFAAFSDHHVLRRKETRTPLAHDENLWSETSNENEHQHRRFDDYSENPGPMFGR